MPVKIGEVANRLFYSVDLQKAQTEFLARRGVDLKKTTRDTTCKQEEKYVPAQRIPPEGDHGRSS